MDTSFHLDFNAVEDSAIPVSSEESKESPLPPQIEKSQPLPKLWAIGGGKGGVGKSLISANFALSLAKKGRKVLAIDLDLGGSNLHTCLGLEPPKKGMSDWAASRVAHVSDLIVATPTQNLDVISGSQEALHVIPLMENRGAELLAELRTLQNYNDIVIDLGAGTHKLTIEFFSQSDQGILSILPEPTSVENAYRFIRAVFFSRIQSAKVSEGVREVIDAAMDPKNILGLRTPADLLAVVERLDENASEEILKQVRSYHPSVVINQVRSQVDIDVGRAICSVCRRYFGLELSYAGFLEYDNAVWKAVRARKAFVQEYPHTLLASRFESLTRTLLCEDKGLFP